MAQFEHQLIGKQSLEGRLLFAVPKSESLLSRDTTTTTTNLTLTNEWANCVTPFQRAA